MNRTALLFFSILCVFMILSCQDVSSDPEKKTTIGIVLPESPSRWIGIWPPLMRPRPHRV